MGNKTEKSALPIHRPDACAGTHHVHGHAASAAIPNQDPCPVTRAPRSFYRLCQVLVVLAWIAGFWFLLAHVGGTALLGKFLRPDYWWLVEMGTAILVLFLISLAYCDPHHPGRRGIGLFFQMGIMVLPLLYLPVAATSELSPEAAKKRSLFLADSASGRESGHRGASPGSIIQKRFTADTQAPRAGDTSLLRLVMDAGSHEGKRVTTIGKVCRDDRLPQDSFFCYQLLMVCCAADARPIGVLVAYDKIDTLESGRWVKVEGTVGITSFQDHRVTQITATEVKPTAPPKDPYLWQ